MRKLATLTAAAALVAGLGLASAANATKVGHWPFDDQTDPTADVSGNGNDADLGSVSGAVDGNDPTFRCLPLGPVAPVPGNVCALEYTRVFTGPDFDTVNSDFAKVPNADVLDVTGAYTIKVWLRIDSGLDTYIPIVVRGADDGVTNANDIEVYVQANSGDLIVAHNRGNGGTFDFVGFVDPPLDTLFHLAVVFDGTDVTAYYNGVAQTVAQQATAMITPLDTDRDWLFGKVNHSAFVGFPAGSGQVKFFDGLMDDLQIHDTALTVEEIAENATGLVKELTSGPDADADDVIDLVVPTTLPEPGTEPYDFTITYSNPGGPDVVILDTVPAESQVTEVEGALPNNGNCFEDIPDGEGGTADATAANNKCNQNKGATKIEWTPEPTAGISTLNVVTDTRQSPSGKDKFKPTSCGPLFLNEGATAFEIDADGNIVFENDEPVIVAGPTNGICLAAVNDPETTSLGPGTSRSATADHDGDGIASFTEACTQVPTTDPCLADTDGDGLNDDVELGLGTDPNVPDTDGDGLSDGDEIVAGTDPLNPDTDGDGVLDGADNCPLEGPPTAADLLAGIILGADGCKRQSQCSDGIDNDFDTFIDFGVDPQCTAITDDDESS